MAIRIIRKLLDLLDVNADSIADGETLVWDDTAQEFIPGSGGGGAAPGTVDYLVGTGDAGLSAEIVVGTTPGGELGGTWSAPTVDATHSGSSHAGVQAAAEATAAAALAAHLLVDVIDGDAAAGVLSGTYPNPGFAVDMATQAELDAAAAASPLLAPATSARNVIQPTGLAVVPLTLKGFAGQTADLQQWQNSAGVVNAVLTALTRLGIGTATPERALHVVGNGILSERASGSPHLALRRTVDFPQEWQFHVGALGEISIRDMTGTVTDAFVLEVDAPDSAFRIKETTGHAKFVGSVITRRVTVPVDNAIDAGELAWWFDATNGAGKAMFKGKTLDGTVVTGWLSLTGLDELAAHLADATDAHDASAVSFAPAGTVVATDVQAAIEELATQATIGKLWLSAAGMWPSLTAGCQTNTKTEQATNDQNLYTLDFDSTTAENAEATIAMPADWGGGTVTATFYWTATGTSTNSVVWKCEGRSYGDSETLDQAWGTLQQIADAHTATALQVLISSATPAITLSGTPAASELVQFRVGRLPADASDTLAVDAMLIGVMISYTRT